MNGTIARYPDVTLFVVGVSGWRIDWERVGKWKNGGAAEVYINRRLSPRSTGDSSFERSSGKPH